ncbi:MAG: GGDEF domain-containing protein [Clostridia bacterium]|nr:GGDEF domain-containing protein [Clostridia bacterium]
MKTKKKKTKGTSGGGIRLQKMNYVMAAITLAISVLLIIATYRTSEGYKQLKNSTDDYIAWNKSANDMQAGSDYLTEQVRLFVITGQKTYLDNYFYEADVAKRRDKSLNKIKEEFFGTEAYVSLEKALQESLTLMSREYYAMRLKAESAGYDLTSYPEKIRSVEISDEDQALSARQKDEKAREMVFDDVYEGEKAIISANTTACLNKLEEEVAERQAAASDRLRVLISREMVLIIAFIAIVICIVVLTTLKVFVPLIRAVPRIREERPIPVTGAYEYRFLAKTYNRMYEANLERKEHLAYEASHDALTGVLNRNGLEHLLERKELKITACLLADVDNFKAINDTYGHGAGDNVLVEVAAKMNEVFGGEYLCRVGGDEFAILFTNPTNKEDIRGKIDRINQSEERPRDDLPAVSISAGVAFSQKGINKKTLFKQADAALYEMKKHGEHGCGFAE